MWRLLTLSKVIMKSERVRDMVECYLLHYRKRNPHPSKKERICAPYFVVLLFISRGS